MARIQDIRGQFPVIFLGGKNRTIKFDLNAFAEMETKFGSVNAALKNLQEGNMKSLRTILWIGLIHEEAIVDETTGEPKGYKITPYQVGGWILPPQIREISEKINEAVNIGMPDIKDVPGAEEKLLEMGYKLEENGTVVAISGDENETKNV